MQKMARIVMIPFILLFLGSGFLFSETQIVLLGTGTPRPDPTRLGPSLAIVVNGSSYLIDCGVDCVRQAVKASTKHNLPSLSAQGLQKAFFTHLHSDHTLGYSDLMMTLWDEREKRMDVYGPKGIGAMTDAILESFKRDISVRVKGFQQSDLDTLRPRVHVLQEGEVYQDENVTVTAFLVPHGTCCPLAYGFKFVTADKTIVVSGDTSKSEAVIEQAAGADVLVHEVYSKQKYEDSADNFKQYLETFHTSSVELAEIARRAKPKLLILTHQLGVNEEDIQAIPDEIRDAGYRGPIANGKDIDLF